MDNPETGALSAESVTSKEQESTEVGSDVSESSEASTEGTSSKERQLVNGRFRSVEDLERSYMELEAMNSRRANEIHQLKNRQQTQDPSREVEEFAEKVKKNPVEAVREIARNEAASAKAEAQAIRFENEYYRLKQNSEFNELEPVMTQIANQYSDLIDEQTRNDPRLLHILFHAARGVKADERSRQAISDAKNQGERAGIKKTKAQIEGSSGSKGNVKPNFASLSLKEMRKEILSGNV